LNGGHQTTGPGMTDWQFVNQVILYGVLGETSPGEPRLEYLANRAIQHPDGYLSTGEIYAGIGEALGSDTVLTESLPGRKPGEQEYRAFLGRLMDRMDAMRPWPEAAFQNLDPSRWPDLGHMVLAARIRLDLLRVQQRLHRVFGQVGEREVLALRLKTGTEVALVAHWWPDSGDVALLQRDPRLPAEQVVQEFREVTGLSPDEITLLAD
jgi:hypothetical protein